MRESVDCKRGRRPLTPDGGMGRPPRVRCGEERGGTCDSLAQVSGDSSDHSQIDHDQEHQQEDLSNLDVWSPKELLPVLGGEDFPHFTDTTRSLLGIEILEQGDRKLSSGS